MVVRCKRIPFLGNIIGADCIGPDTDKVSPKYNMIEGCQRITNFLGLANYLGRFIPHIATVSTPLRDVVKANVPYQWGPEQDAAF